jgi:hypothetical protein
VPKDSGLYKCFIAGTDLSEKVSLTVSDTKQVKEEEKAKVEVEATTQSEVEIKKDDAVTQNDSNITTETDETSPLNETTDNDLTTSYEQETTETEVYRTKRTNDTFISDNDNVDVDKVTQVIPELEPEEVIKSVTFYSRTDKAIKLECDKNNTKIKWNQLDGVNIK